MARISTYPLDGAIASTDKLLGTDENNVTTKNFQLSDVSTYIGTQILGYSSYVALLNQTGTNAIVPTVIKNDLGITITGSRQSGGDYTLTSTGTPFTANKTVVFINGGAAENNHDIAWERTSTNTIVISTHNSDDKLTNGSLEIRVYA
jgi:hypothetical protein